MSALAVLRRAVLDLVFPPRCVVCGRGDDFLCERCRSELPPAGGARCQVCWQPHAWAWSLCADCRAERPAFRLLRAPYRYDGVARKAVLALKFRGLSSAAEPMGELMAGFARDEGLQADGVVPVPLNPGRQRSRGYNQSQLLAERVAEALEASLDTGLLRRRRRTRPQVGLSAEQRRENVRDAFEVVVPALARGRRLLLVDDVATTGATLDACAKVLLAAGAVSVDALVFARED